MTLEDGDADERVFARVLARVLAQLDPRLVVEEAIRASSVDEDDCDGDDADEDDARIASSTTSLGSNCASASASTRAKTLSSASPSSSVIKSSCTRVALSLIHI